MKAIDEKTKKIIDLGIGSTLGVFIRLDFSKKGLPVFREQKPITPKLPEKQKKRTKSNTP